MQLGNGNHTLTKQWTDKRLGRHGVGAWIAPIGIIAVVSEIFLVLYGIVLFKGELTAQLFLLGALVFGLYLFKTVYIFLLCAPRTIQRAEQIDEVTIDIYFYFGKKKRLSLNPPFHCEIKNINRACQKSALFDKKSKNYEIKLSNSEYFYVSHFMHGADDFVGLLITKYNMTPN